MSTPTNVPTILLTAFNDVMYSTDPIYKNKVDIISQLLTLNNIKPDKESIMLAFCELSSICEVDIWKFFDKCPNDQDILNVYYKLLDTRCLNISTTVFVTFVCNLYLIPFIKKIMTEKDLKAVELKKYRECKMYRFIIDIDTIIPVIQEINIEDAARKMIITNVGFQKEVMDESILTKKPMNKKVIPSCNMRVSGKNNGEILRHKLLRFIIVGNIKDPKKCTYIITWAYDERICTLSIPDGKEIALTDLNGVMAIYMSMFKLDYINMNIKNKKEGCVYMYKYFTRKNNKAVS